MFGNHVSSLSAAYFDGELTPAESNRVAEHLLVCARCRAEFDAVKSGIGIANQIEIVPAPEDLWSGINTRLDQPNTKPRLWFLKPVAVTAAVVLVVGIVLWLQPARSAEGQWHVASLGGAPRIKSGRRAANQLAGDW
jgi:predicted anti-sigma-YlaC factor YlaD